MRENLLATLERPKISKIAKFESDLLKTNEDIAPQSREILQTFVSWGAETCPPPYKGLHFRYFVELYLHSLNLNFINLKALFPVVQTDFPQLALVKS